MPCPEARCHVLKRVVVSVGTHPDSLAGARSRPSFRGHTSTLLPALNLHITRGKHTTFVSFIGDGAAYSPLNRVARVDHDESCSVAQAHVVCSLHFFAHKIARCLKRSLSSAHSLQRPREWQRWRRCAVKVAQYDVPQCSPYQDVQEEGLCTPSPST